MHQGYADKDDLPNDLAELEKLRRGLSDSLLVLHNEIKMFSNELGESYSDALKSGGIRYNSSDSELLCMSNHNDRLLNEFADLDEKITRVEYKINSIRKNMRDS